MGELIFVVGGAGSGKSRFALQIAREWDPKVAFVATCASGDGEMAKKIANHRRERPEHWLTIEAAENPFKVNCPDKTTECLLVDSLTLWVSEMLLKGHEREDVIGKCARFLPEARSKFRQTIVVSDEVGFGIVPENDLARRFRQVLGAVNQRAADIADEVFLISVGLPIQLKANRSGTFNFKEKKRETLISFESPWTPFKPWTRVFFLEPRTCSIT